MFATASLVSAAAPAEIAGQAGALQALDLYRRPVLERCGPGNFSVTGEAPCEPCPKGTYSGDTGATKCSPCPAGSTTRQVGSVEETACKAPVCPGATATSAASEGPDSHGDCICPYGSSCDGDADFCSTSSSTGTFGC